MSKFKLSQRSRDRLAGVHPDLVKVVNRAIEITSIDFGITEGLRTVDRQRELVASGASKTMNSRHITGHAVDVVAYLGSEIRWDFALYQKIAEAFQAAARELGIPVVWGACWEVLNTTSDLTKAIADYTARKKREGGKPLIDGVHFELHSKRYPA